MEFSMPQSRDYLYELYTLSQGDTNSEISMYEVGAGIGLEKADAGTIAEELMVEGCVELKTLAGGISITAEGLKALNVKDPSAGSNNRIIKLGDDIVLNDQSRSAVTDIITEIKNNVTGRTAEYLQLEEIIIDIKTIEIQMLSPKPKTSVFRELLKSLETSLLALGSDEISQDIHEMISPEI
jgi:hypothetical protein